MTFLRDRASSAVTLLLLLGCAGVYASASLAERIGDVRPLSELPKSVGAWLAVRDDAIEAEIQNVLRADDTLLRTYAGPDKAYANLFIAFFKSQRLGSAPHSPKNCLPGSGWVPSRSDTVAIPIPGRAEGIEVNRYVISKGESKSLVLYWYQSHNRVIASEYSAKIHLVLDSLRYRRSDTSIVRVVVPIVDSEASAEQQAVSFVQAAFGPISKVLPG
jgi:EpsI family protein